jgi:hypothetical protein
MGTIHFDANSQAEQLKKKSNREKESTYKSRLESILS